MTLIDCSTERADTALAEGKLDDALAQYVVLLQNDLDDLYVWYRLMQVMTKVGQREVVAESLPLFVHACAVQGHLLLAICAGQTLEELSPGTSHRVMEIVARMYGADSKAITGHRKAVPPAVPMKFNAAQMPGDIKVAKIEAEDVCRQALSHWQQKAKEPAHVPYHPLLSELTARDLLTLCPLMVQRLYPAGTVVIHQGEVGDSLYIVVRGTVAVKRNGVELAFLRSGAFFGEMALLSHSPRTAEVVCEIAATLFEIKRDDLVALAERNPQVAEVLAQYTRDRLLSSMMATSPLFQPLDLARRDALMELFETRLFDEGEVAIAEGDVAEGLYVVLSGIVQVLRRSEVLAELGSGQIFGEISLIQNRPSTANVMAKQKTVTLFLPKDVFNSHVAEFPEVLAHAYQLAILREQSGSKAPPAAPRGALV